MEHVLVDRTGQTPNEDSTSPQSTNPSLLDWDRETERLKTLAMTREALAATKQRTEEAPVERGKQQLLDEMLQRTDDPVFREQLMLLRSINRETQTATRDLTGPARVSVATLSASGPLNDRQLESSDSQLEPTANHRAISTGPVGRSGLGDVQVSPTDLQRQLSPSSDLRQTANLAISDSSQSLAPKNAAWNGPAMNSQLPAGQQSMQVEVVSSDPRLNSPGSPRQNDAGQQGYTEADVLREQLREANELNRQILQATSSMMPNLLNQAQGGFGAGSPMAMANPMLGTGLNSGLEQDSAAGILGGPNQMVANMLRDKMQQQFSQQMTQLDPTTTAEAKPIAPFELSSNRMIGSGIEGGTETNGKGEMVSPASYNEQIDTDWKQDLTLATESLRRSIPKSADAKERQTLELYLRFLELISNNHDSAVRTIESFPPEMQDFWRHQIFALSQIMKQPDQEQDALFINNARRATKTVGHLKDAMQSLQNVASLRLTHLTFCEAVRSFGDYDVASTTTIQSGDPLLVYCEVENFATRKLHSSSGERFVTRLMPSYTIFNEQNQRMFQEEYQVVEDQCKTLRQDFFLTLSLNTPASLPAGRYYLVMSVEDQEGNKIATGSPLSFYIR